MAASCTLAATFLVCSSAGAQPEPTRLNAKLEARGSTVLASFDVTTAFTEAFRKQLGGGLTRDVFMSVQLVDRGGDTLAEAARRCQLRLDIWEDVVFVRVQEGNNVRRRTYVLIDEALRACGQVKALSLVDRKLMTKESGYRVEVVVALNPVSPEVMEKSREFMSNPRGTSTGRSRALLGAVVRLFGSHPSLSDDVFLFKSDGLARPKAEAAP